jgi:uncharacterized protein
LAVRAQPGARRNGVVGEQGGALKVAVTAPADQGKANKAIVEALAEGLGLKKAQVALIGGVASRSKRFLLRGVTADDVRKRLSILSE